MNDYLFKLKKDGKTVGYLKIADGAIWYEDEQQVWDLYGGVDWLDFDTAHPFVTKNKDGKDVFEGDKISFTLTKGFDANSRGTGIVYWCKNRLAFCVSALPAWDIRIGHNCMDIELIEEKDND